MPYASVISRIAHKIYDEAPSLIPESPWWAHLSPDFHSTPEDFDLRLRDKLAVETTQAIDVLIRTGGASAVGALALPVGYNPLELRATLRDRKLYRCDVPGDPKRFFKRPPRGVEIQEHEPTWPWFKPENGRCVDLSFESPYRPFNPRIRKRYTRNAGNRTAHARYWQHNDGGRPTIIAIHGFGADPHWLNEWFFALPWFYKIGADVLLFTLPFHGARQSRLSPFSGYGFFAGGVAGINEAFGQAIFDLRIFMDHLMERRGVEQIGVTGVSLGGHTTALLASVDDRIAFAIPNVPVTSIPDLVLEWWPIGPLIKYMSRVMRLSIVEIRALMAISCPLSYAPLIPKKRRLIIGGVGDRLAPPKHSRLLWDHWDRCNIHWFPGSHVIHLDRGAYLRHMASFMTDAGFLSRA